ncbi:Carbohydrate binding domain [Popillia japonica]|uniref:Carbohydrate binding domain n=1 Tax=Popillia japonica TaxID=7064 RepID=A0AAW1HV38_POPJA
MNKTGTGGDLGIRQSNIPLPIGCEYTLSCYARASIAGTIAKLQVGETGYAWVTKEVTLTTEWVKYSYTFKTLYPTTSFIFGLATSRTGPAEFCGMKLEAGNKATDWSLSPWDVTSRLTKLEAAVKLEAGNKATDWSLSPWDVTSRLTKLEAAVIALGGTI